MPSPRHSQDPSLTTGGRGGGMGGVSLVFLGGVALTRQEKGGVGLILQKKV